MFVADSVIIIIIILKLVQNIFLKTFFDKLEILKVDVIHQY